MAENKISQEHLEELQSGVSKINQVALQIGNLELQSDLSKFQAKLEEKYGKVSVNIQDGTYEPIEEEKTSE